MTDFPGTNDWHGPATHRGVPDVKPEEMSGEDRRRLKQTERAALVAANNARALLGLSEVDHIEPGKPKNPYSCPLANTIKKGADEPEDLQVRVDTEDIRVRGVSNITPTDAVKNFIVWVDHGFYPDLIK
jgi:hypothetical protein